MARNRTCGMHIQNTRDSATHDADAFLEKSAPTLPAKRRRGPASAPPASLRVVLCLSLIACNGATLQTKATQRSQFQDFSVLPGQRRSVRPGRRGCGFGDAAVGCFAGCSTGCATASDTDMCASPRFSAMRMSDGNSGMLPSETRRRSLAVAADDAVALELPIIIVAWSEVGPFGLGRRSDAKRDATSAFTD